MFQLKNTIFTGFALALLATLLWSGNFIAARALHKDIPPVSLAFFRWLTATIFILPFALNKIKKESKYLFQNKWLLFFSAITGVSFFNTFIYIAGHYTSAMNLALIGTTAAPVFVLIITALILRKHILPVQIAGALLCIAGIILLISKGSMDELRRFHLGVGDLWIFSAALSFAIYTILVRKKPIEISATSFLFSIFALGTLLLFPPFLIEWSRSKPIIWSSTLIIVLLYLGIGASVIAFLCWNGSIQKIGPARTALVGNLIPVFSSLEAVLILNEKFTWVTVTSMLVILSGLLIANWTVWRKAFYKK